jgi:hypothetical protein
MPAVIADIFRFFKRNILTLIVKIHSELLFPTAIVLGVFSAAFLAVLVVMAAMLLVAFVVIGIYISIMYLFFLFVKNIFLWCYNRRDKFLKKTPYDDSKW